MNETAFPPDLVRDVAKRRTFAIISHPDAGKTTLTEKLLLYGGAIQMAGTVKSRKSKRHATSDWMEVEKQRGHLGHELGDAVRVRRPHDQPARYAGPRGLLRGHLPRADRSRRRGDGDRRGKGRRGADDQAARSLPASRDADHHLRQQDGPRGARAARDPRGDRGGARDRLRAGLLADRHGQALSRRLRSAARSARALRARRRARQRRERADRRDRQSAPRRRSFPTKSARCGTTSI